MLKRGREDLPLARSEDLLTEQIGAETIVYDSRSRDAHCLSPVAAVVFARSDGRTSPADLATIAGDELGERVDVGLVEQALAELEEHDLIVAPPQGDGISRRQFARRTAAAGGAAFALPLVTSVVMPAYGQAISGCTDTSLSHTDTAFTCGGTIYLMRWNVSSADFCVFDAAVCGVQGSGGCDNYPEDLPTPTTSACLAGANAIVGPRHEHHVHRSGRLPADPIHDQVRQLGPLPYPSSRTPRPRDACRHRLRQLTQGSITGSSSRALSRRRALRQALNAAGSRASSHRGRQR